MSTDQSYDEKELLFQISTGDEAAFAALVKQYSGLLYTYIFRIVKDVDVASDVVQEIFTQLWLTRESLTKVDTFRSYLFVISRNHAVRLLKNIDKEKESLRQWWQARGQDFDTPHTEDQARAAEGFDKVVAAAIDRLPAQQKRVWLMSRQEGKKYAEIAAEMNISKETVKKYLQIASQSMATYIKEHGLNALIAYLITKL